MKIKKIKVQVDDGSCLGSEVHITFGNVAGEVTYFQSGASVEVLGFTLPIAEAALELVHEEIVEVAS